MTTFSLRVRSFGALLAASAALLAPRIATAQECTNDTDCGAGYRCETHEYESCSGGGMCAPDGECTETEPVCETSEYSSCAPAPCASDADCPDRMACHQQSYWVCDGGMAGGAGGAGGAPAPTCRPDGSCDDPGSFPEPTCWEEPGDSLCTPRHQLPCQVAGDCGGGFDCIESIYWVCSGMGSGGSAGSADPGAGGGSPMEPPPPTTPPSAGAAAPGEEYECHAESSGQFYCQLQDLPCTADADCPSGLECREQYLYPPCMGGAGGTGTGGAVGTAGTSSSAGAGGVAGGSDDGMSAPPDDSDYVCPEPTVQQRCMPPEYYGGMPGYPGPGTGGSTGGSAGAGEEPPTEPPSGGGGNGTGSGGSGGGPTSGDGDDNGGEAEGPGHGNGGNGHHFGWLARGCSAGGPISADPLSWLALGLVALVLRRRARDLG